MRVVKLDASGNILWQHTFGGTNYETATSVVATSDGGAIVAGYSGSKDGDAAGTHWGTSDDDVWVIKLDQTGTMTWQNSYGGSKEDHANAIRQTTDGGYIVAGSTVSSDGQVSGKHGIAYDNQDYWVIRLDNAGALLWQKCLGGSGPGVGAGSGNDVAYDVLQDDDGGYVVVGTVSSGSTTNEDITGYHGSTGSDFWVVKLNDQGDITWEKCLGGSGTEEGHAIVKSEDGGYVVAGSELSVDGDVNGPDVLYSHAWVVKLLAGVNGIYDPTATAGAILYPNPASDAIHVVRAPMGAELTVMDPRGRTVARAMARQNDQLIDLPGLRPGLYTVRIATKETTIERSFIER